VEYRGVAQAVRLARAPQGSELHPVLVNGQVGAVVTIHGRPFSIMAFTVVADRVVEINGIRDPDRVRRLAATVLAKQ
jgi:RNA polymerase sigma-70 factor (ECF subfamily)